MLDEAVWSRVSVLLAEPVEELHREESGLTRPGAKLEEEDDALESVLTEPRETKARRRAQELARERLVEEMQDDATRLDRIESTIAAVEQAGATEVLDYEG